ncbi:MAG: NTP transferase domain-containing protein [Spirochaetales bacterium]|nr:NTP transferase domain-containing protein [Spirochaetales bacterium]
MPEHQIRVSRYPAFVQARMLSTRLPGKSLRVICGKPLLEWVMESVALASLVSGVYLLTSRDRSDDPLAELAARMGVRVYRGPLEDVMLRFLEAARQYNFDTILRICADNPFVNPDEIDRLCNFYAKSNHAYAYNHVPSEGNGYPDGLGAEIVSVQALRECYPEASPEDREHVTAVVRQTSGRAGCTFEAPPEIRFPWIKLDIDTELDFVRMEALMQNIIARGLNPRNASEVCKVYAELWPPPVTA